MRMAQLPNCEGYLREPFLWTSVPYVEPANKLLMHNTPHIAGGFAASESGGKSCKSQVNIIGILVDLNWLDSCKAEYHARL